MTNENGKLRNIVAQGWTGMLLLLLMMLCTNFAEYGIANDFSPLVDDPGINGLWSLAVLVSVNVLMQMAVKSIDARPFRWFTFAMALLYTLFFMVHQLSHLTQGEGLDTQLIFDITHHVVGIWTTIAAFKWARMD